MPCLRPKTVIAPSGLSVRIRCQRCAPCCEDKRRDWTGRCLAEAAHSKGAYAITLTYGTDRRIQGDRDKEGARRLRYDHVQKYLKRIRKAGYVIRYFIAGEYGRTKDRAHWHCLIFFQNAVPPMPEHVTAKRDIRFKPGAVSVRKETRCWDDPFWRKEKLNPKWRYDWDERRAFLVKVRRRVRKLLLRRGLSRNEINEKLDRKWSLARPPKYISEPIGITCWEPLNVGSVRYLTKYVTKSFNAPEDQQTMYRMSKNPVLGYRVFDRLAELNVEQGLAPRDRLYSVPGNVHRDTRIAWKYYMNSACLSYFIRRYLDAWFDKNPDKHYPPSKLVDDWCDKHTQSASSEFRPTPFRKVYRPQVYPDGKKWIPGDTDGKYPFRLDPKLNCFVYHDPEKGRLLWSYDEQGRRGWSKTIMSPAEAAMRRAQAKRQLERAQQLRGRRAGPRPRYRVNAEGWTEWIRLGAS